MRMPEFLRDGDGKERIDVRMTFRLTLAELTNVMANRVAIEGVLVGKRHVPPESFRGDEKVTPGRTMEIIREGLSERGMQWTARDEDTPEIFRLWAQQQLIIALLPAHRNK